MPTDTARCPGCGAPAAADSAACAYCGAALATVTCPSCFAAMFVGSRFCARCGAEAARGLRDETPLECPRCAEEMQAINLGATAVQECGACGGLWLDPQTLQVLCDARERYADVGNALATRSPTATMPTDTVRYIPCPQCSTLMNRVNFAKSSGVVVDVCKTHGVWLDRGELQRVIGFVEGGGMTVARNRERERLAEEQRRLAAMQQRREGELGAPGNLGTTGAWSTHVRRDTISPVGTLLHDVLGLFLK